MKENCLLPSSSMLDFEILDLGKSGLFVLSCYMLLQREDICLAYLLQVLHRLKCVIYIDISIYKTLT